MFDRKSEKASHKISFPPQHTLSSPVYGEHSSRTLYFFAALVESKLVASGIIGGSFSLSDHLSIVSDLATYPDYFGNHQRPRTPFCPTLADYQELAFAEKIDLQPTSDFRKNSLTCAQIADHLLISLAFSRRKNDSAINLCRWFYKSADFYLTRTIEATQEDSLLEKSKASSSLFKNLANGVDGVIDVLKEVIFDSQK